MGVPRLRAEAHGLMPDHLHTCIACGQPYPCGLDCDGIEDGEPVCGVCAERRFLEIGKVPS